MIYGSQLLLDSPAVISLRRATGFDLETAHHIPGASFRGALAAAVLQSGLSASDKDFHTVFTSGLVRFPDHRLLDPHPEQRRDPSLPWSLPWPLSAVVCKENEKDHSPADLLLYAAAGGSMHAIPCPDCYQRTKRPSSLFFDYDSRGRASSRTVRTHRRAHSQISPLSLSAEPRQFHSSRLLDSNQIFWGQLWMDPEAQHAFHRLVEKLETSGSSSKSRILWLGRGRSRGQGRSLWSCAPLPRPASSPLLHRIRAFHKAAARFEPLRNKLLLSATLLSPAILLDQWLQPWASPPAAAISPLLEDFETCLPFCAFTSIAGWHAAAGYPKFSITGFAPGSVFLFSKDLNSDPEHAFAKLAGILDPLELQGIGERLSEGFGEVRFCETIHSRHTTPIP